jgi:NAD(P)-dependent dehydrogenase (short-subunit alcohol dehydrogenase family)
MVYCTGRSVKGRPSAYKRPETIDETAAMINAAGGTAIPVRVDHTVESEVKALFRRIDRKHERLDVLVNSIAGEDPMLGQWGNFWQANLKNADAIFRQALTSHIITAKHAVPIMIRTRHGLIVEVTENDLLGGGGNPMSQVVKAGLKLLALNMAAELKAHGVAAVAMTPRIPPVRIHAAALCRHRSELAGRRQEGPKLFGIRIAALRRPCCRGAGQRSERPRADRPASQLLGGSSPLRLHGLRRPSSRLGTVEHRLVGDASAVC